jgi:hypothetical protein
MEQNAIARGSLIIIGKDLKTLTCTNAGPNPALKQDILISCNSSAPRVVPGLP